MNAMRIWTLTLERPVRLEVGDRLVRITYVPGYGVWEVSVKLGRHVVQRIRLGGIGYSVFEFGIRCPFPCIVKLRRVGRPRVSDVVPNVGVLCESLKRSYSAPKVDTLLVWR
jgi:hypothetical protein